MNICMCGAQAGYPHEHDCPRPLYRGSEKDCLRWIAEREQLRRVRVQRMHPLEAARES